jgi:hypothetical protein
MSIKSVWNLSLQSSNSSATVYELTSDNDIKFSSQSTAMVSSQSPPEVVMETDNVSGSGRTHDPALLTDPMTGAMYDPFDYERQKDLHASLTIRGNSWNIEWNMSRIHTTRDYSFTGKTQDVNMMTFMFCDKTETGMYDASLPGFRGMTSSCNGTSSETIVDADGPPHICAPNGSLSGTFDPKTGLITADVTMDDASCGGAAGNCFDPYSPKGVWGPPDTCTTHVHYTIDLQVPPQP